MTAHDERVAELADELAAWLTERYAGWEGVAVAGPLGRTSVLVLFPSLANHLLVTVTRAEIRPT